MLDIAGQEQLVDQYVKENNKDAAAKLLSDLAAKFAREKDFAKAEALRDRLYDIDPEALPEIIRSSEIIDQEKTELIGRDQLDVWSALYKSLSTEEANTLYLAMKERTYDPDNTIFEQGERNSNLYFINQGESKIVYRKDGQEILLKTLKPGDIAGEETFLTPSLSTVALITLSQVKLNFLENKTFVKWEHDLPTLCSALREYCSRTDRITGLLKTMDLDRRSQKRVNLSGKAVVQLLNRHGNPIGKRFKAELLNISSGGLAFSMRISNQENARVLLGRKLKINLMLLSRGVPESAEKKATVVALRSRSAENPSVHLKFDRSLSRKRYDILK